LKNVRPIFTAERTQRVSSNLQDIYAFYDKVPEGTMVLIF